MSQWVAGGSVEQSSSVLLFVLDERASGVYLVYHLFFRTH